MKILKLLTLLILSLTLCVKNNPSNSLPALSQLNIEAKNQLSLLRDLRGKPSEHSQRLGVKAEDMVRMKAIEVTKVFKQNEEVMLVSRLNLASKEREYFADVIFSYRSNQNNFKKLINRMIEISASTKSQEKKVTAL